MAFLHAIHAILVAIDSQAIVGHRHDHLQGLKLSGTTKHSFPSPNAVIRARKGSLFAQLIILVLIHFTPEFSSRY